MIGTLTFFIISIIGMVGILFVHQKNNKTPDFFIRCDVHLRRWIDKTNNWIRFINKKTLGLLIHYVLEKIEILVNAILRSLKKKVKK